MNKEEFLQSLKKALKTLPKIDIEKSLSYYSEIIEDKLEEGLKEADIIAEFESIDQIATKIITDSSTNIKQIEVKKEKPSIQLKTLVIIITFPIWVSLLAGLFGGLVGIYAAFIAIIFTLFVLAFSFFIGGFAVTCVSIYYFFINLPYGLFYMACGFALIGLGILIYPVSKIVLKYEIRCLKWISSKIAQIFKKEAK